MSPQVILLLAQSETFEFVLANSADISVVNAQKLTLGSHLSAVVSFLIKPVALGMVDITVDAVSAEASDSLVWKVLVQVCDDVNGLSPDLRYNSASGVLMGSFCC